MALEQVMGLQVEGEEREGGGVCHGRRWALSMRPGETTSNNELHGWEIALNLPNLGLRLVNKIPGLCVLFDLARIINSFHRFVKDRVHCILF